MKVFLISYNRLSSLRSMARYLTDCGLEVIILDNRSSYPPLVEWYADCGYEVIVMRKNHNHFVLWTSDLINEFDDRYYIVSDVDLDLSKVPTDFVDVLMQGLRDSPEVIKSGLSLEINDLPDNPYAKEVYNWEKKFWTQRRGLYYLADIDTTLALYDRERDFGELPGGLPSNNKFFSAVRSPRPYTARHLPWYLTKEQVENNPEEKYFLSQSQGYWATKFKELLCQ